MSAPAWIRSLLRESKYPFEEVYHSAAFTAQELAENERTSGHHVAKVIVVVADGQPNLLVLPASRQVALPKVREALDATYVRFASEEELRFYCPDCEVGATPPLRHWPQIPLLVDYRMEVEGNILFPAGTHSDGIVMKYEDWTNLVQPRRARFSTNPTQDAQRVQNKIKSCFRDEKKANMALGA